MNGIVSTGAYRSSMQSSPEKRRLTLFAMSIVASLDRDYSPSVWNRRYLSPEAVIEDHVTRTLLESDKARKNLFSVRGLRYGSTEKNILDLYSTSPDIPCGSPMVVYIHGGYWDALSIQESAYLAPALCNKAPNTVFIAVDYVLASEEQFGLYASMTGLCTEMAALLRSVHALANNLGCSGIHFIGHSAGAHLVAAMMSLDYSDDSSVDLFGLIKSIWLVSGVFDLDPISRTYVNDPLHLTRLEVEKFSPVNQADKFAWNLSAAPDCEIHIVYGEWDPPVFHEQSCLYHETLKNALPDRTRLPEPVEVPGRDHFDVIDTLQDNYVVQGLLEVFEKQSRRQIPLTASPQSSVTDIRKCDLQAIMQSSSFSAEETEVLWKAAHSVRNEII